MGLKVPVLDAPSVAQQAGPEAQVYRYEANDSMARALSGAGQQVGRGLSAVGQTVETERKKAEAEADAVVESDAFLQLDAANAKALDYLRAQKGREASAQSAAAIEAFDKNRRDIAETLNPRAKARFLARSAETTLAYRRSAEKHVATEFELARDGTMKARMGQAVAMAEAGVLDRELFDATVASAERDIRANARTEQEADAAVEAFHGAVSMAQVKSMLARKQYDEARAFIDSNRKQLGTFNDEADKLFEQATEARKRDQLAADALGAVDDAAAEAAKAGDGYVSEQQMRKLVDPLRFPPEQQRRVAEALEHRIRVEEAKLKDAVEHHRNEINKADLHGQPIPGASEAFLERHNDADWLLARKHRLEGEQRARVAFARATAKAGRPDTSSARREQNDLDKEFIFFLQGRLAEDPQANPDEALVEWINRTSEREGHGVTISDVAKAQAGALSKKTVAREATDEGRALNRNERDFKAEVGSALASTLKTKKGVDQSKLAELTDAALDEYRRAVDAKGGKPLTAEEMAAIRARAVRKTSEGGFLGIGAKTVYGAEKFEPHKPTSVRMRFRGKDGTTFEQDVPVEKVEAAKRKGGVQVGR